MNPEQPRWMQQLVQAAEVAAAKYPNSNGPNEQRVARVEHWPERGEGWYRCAAPKSANFEWLEEASLGPAGGTGERKHQVIESAVEHPWLYVRAGSSTPKKDMYLWAPAFDLRELAEALRDSLRELPAGSLAERFATRTLDPIPAASVAAAGLHGSQAEAFRACCAPGLQLIWGPPGTGKTHVIAKSVNTLLAQDKTVLLVSSTNVAVDNAVENIASQTDAPPGTIVRVGTPVVPAVAKDPRVALPLLIDAKQAALNAKIAELSDQISRLERDERRRRLTKAEQRLKGFDADAYDAAVLRASNQRAAALAHSAVTDANERLEELRHRLTAQTEEAFKAEWVTVRSNEAAVGAEIAQIKAGLEHLSSLNRWARFRAKVDVVRLNHQLQDARTRQVTATADVREFEERARKANLDPWEIVDESETRIPPAAAGQQWSTALRDLKVLDKATRHAKAEAKAALQRFMAAMAQPMPDPEDAAFIAEADREGYPALHKELPLLRRAESAVRGEISKSSKKIEAAEEERAKMRRSAEATVIKEASVVACTLAALSRRRPIRERRFDYVIIDEAAACLLPQLVNAVGRARIGAVLVGDYLQNGPIVDRPLAKVDSLKPFYGPDCFTRFKVTDAASAHAEPGCAVLDEQRRFGPPVTNLINEVVYEGILKQWQNDGGELVLIDVDGIGGTLTGINRSGKYKGHWPIGALLARAIAEHHTREGKTVGVVTPYKEQELATKSMLDDSPYGPEVEVGTAHAFQGREFDTVLFDMVEDGRGRIAAAHRDGGFHLDGLRIFNVALTRAKTRTYIVAQGGAVHRAKSGPLAAIYAGFKSGLITRVSAREVLGLDEPAVGTRTEAFDDLRNALKDYVQVRGYYDQVTTFGPLIQCIDQARDSVWFWSPWIGSENLDIQDSLVDAAARGVKVTILTRPPNGLTEKQAEGSQAFQDRFTGRVIFQPRMHQKIAVIDRRRAFIGSMNMLSARENPSRRSKEFMLDIESGPNAVTILAQEKDTDLLQSIPCPECGTRMNHVDIRGPRDNRRWNWVCNPSRDGCKGRTEFNHDPIAHRADDNR